jgi:hypothetical protein
MNLQNIKYLTHINLNILYIIAKKLKIKQCNNNKSFNKLHLINKINLKLLYLLKKNKLLQFINLYKLNNFNNKSSYTKIKLIYFINNYIKKTKKYNLILQFYNLNLTNINTYKNKEIEQIIQNNETFGITCEYTICKLYNLNNNLKNRINNNFFNLLNSILTKFKSELLSLYNLKCVKFVGYKNNLSDFICQNIVTKKIYTLSIKSNINNNMLVCPQIIGQTTKKSFIKQLKSFNQFKSIKLKSIYSIKRCIIKNIYKLLPIYYKYLFCCDYLLWITKRPNNITYKLITKLNNFKINPSKLSFTKKLKEWKESNTLKYNNTTIGVFQIHNNRDCIKFRFHLQNLLKILN